ncbi:hypothetical protein BDW68DRAFT_171512 [Aspergillus falconensis]
MPILSDSLLSFLCLTLQIEVSQSASFPQESKLAFSSCFYIATSIPNLCLQLLLSQNTFLRATCQPTGAGFICQPLFWNSWHLQSISKCWAMIKFSRVVFIGFFTIFRRFNELPVRRRYAEVL